jgi:hypothetical protein
MCGVIRVEARSWTVMARGGSGVCWRCAGSPSGGPEYCPGPVLQHGCDTFPAYKTYAVPSFLLWTGTQLGVSLAVRVPMTEMAPICLLTSTLAPAIAPVTSKSAPLLALEPLCLLAVDVPAQLCSIAGPLLSPATAVLPPLAIGAAAHSAVPAPSVGLTVCTSTAPSTQHHIAALAGALQLALAPTLKHDVAPPSFLPF